VADFFYSNPWLWTALCVLLGLLVGMICSGMIRQRLSLALHTLQQQEKLSVGDVESRKLGIVEFGRRIRESKEKVNTAFKASELLEQTYLHLQAELKVGEAASIEIEVDLTKRQAELGALQPRVAILGEALTSLKRQFSELEVALDTGKIAEEQLEQELTRGLIALCEHSGGELTVVQELLLQSANEATSAEPGAFVALLEAKVQLLQNQVQYWQGKAMPELSEYNSNR
jgi:hypothetical protein